VRAAPSPRSLITNSVRLSSPKKPTSRLELTAVAPGMTLRRPRPGPCCNCRRRGLEAGDDIASFVETLRVRLLSMSSTACGQDEQGASRALALSVSTTAGHHRRHTIPSTIRRSPEHGHARIIVFDVEQRRGRTSVASAPASAGRPEGPPNSRHPARVSRRGIPIPCGPPETHHEQRAQAQSAAQEAAQPTEAAPVADKLRQGGAGAEQEGGTEGGAANDTMGVASNERLGP
jgi:hypothetical protein